MGLLLFFKSSLIKTRIKQSLFQNKKYVLKWGKTAACTYREIQEKNGKWGFKVKDLNIKCKQKYPAA